MTRPVLRAFRTLLSAAALLAAAALLPAGCESAEGADVSISATKRDLRTVGETTVLTGSGWGHYVWSLSDSSLGVLSSKTGESVIYTATKMPDAGGSHLNQVVTCQTTDPGGGGGAFGTITIRHLSEGGTATSAAASNSATERENPPSGGGSGEGGGSSPSRLTLSQSSVTVELSASTITAVPISVVSPVTGRTYRWSLSPSLGRLNTTTGTSVSYTPPSSTSYRGRTVTVTCTDSITRETASCAVSLQ